MLDAEADQAFTLHPIDDVTPQLRGPEWLAALPDETFEDRRLKEIFRVQCSECHQAGIPLQNRFDEQGWAGHHLRNGEGRLQRAQRAQQPRAGGDAVPQGRAGEVPGKDARSGSLADEAGADAAASHG